MAGKFLQIWPLRSVAKTMALLIIILLAVAIYATREIPDSFKDSEEWRFWRNLDFAVCIVSLAFASVLLYGSITEFRMFVLFWMIWNVILTVFWIILLVRKYDEFMQWERTFRLIAIIFMVLAEIPVFNYFRYLGVKIADPEKNFSWMATQSEKVYKNLDERPSLTSAVHNLGFREDSARNSVISVASEETEQSDNRKEEKVDKREENVEEHEEELSDTESQTSIEISVTVHSKKPVEGNDADASEFIEIANSETAQNVLTTSEEPLSTTETAQRASPSSTEFEEDNSTKETVTESDEINSEVSENEAFSSMDITEDTEEEEMEPSPRDSRVVVEIENEDSTTKSSHVDSSVVTVEIDVTDTAHDDANQTSS